MAARRLMRTVVGSSGSRPRRLAAVVCAAATLFLACPEEEETETGEQPIAVRVRTLAAQPYTLRHTFVGEVQPWRSITLSSQIGERIVAFQCDKGDEVTTGQLLARIDDRDVQFDLRDAEARVEELEQLLAKTRSITRPQQLATLQARCVECSASLRQAHLDYERGRQLLADNVISKSQFDQLEAAYEAAQARVTVSQEELKLAQEGSRDEDIRTVEVQLERARVTVERARKRLADSRIESPARALVVRRYHEAGETVRPGEPVVDLVEIDRIKVLLHVAEQDLVRLAEGQAVVVVADALAGRLFDGAIHYVSDAADAQLRTFDVEIAVANCNRALKPGMVARVTVDVGRVERALVVDENLVVEREGQMGFFYLDGDETVAFFPLQDAIRDNSRWIVPAPAEPIGPVIETRTTRLAPGVRVHPVNGAGEPNADLQNPKPDTRTPDPEHQTPNPEPRHPTAQAQRAKDVPHDPQPETRNPKSKIQIPKSK